MNHRRQPNNPASAIETQGLDIWQILNRFLIGIFLLAVASIVVSKFWSEFENQRQINQQVAQLRSEEDRLRERRTSLKDQFEWLRDDPAYREIAARDRLDLQKPGETIFRIERK